ncbi:unnamed protein product [Urochloa humidicola]
MDFQLHLQLQAQAGNANKPGAVHAAAAALLLDEEANIPNNGARQADINAAGGSASPTCFAGLGFLFLTLNSGLAIVRSRGEATAIAFVCFTYADLVALFACFRLFERAGAGSPKRTTLKLAVWLLTTMLTVAFSYKVAAVTPLPVAVHVWLMAATTVAGGFYAFFIHEEK